MTTVEIPVQGSFDLRRAIGFGFGQRDAGSGDVMRLAFCLDGYRQHAAAAVTQPAADVLLCDVVAGDDPDAVAAHAARVLSVDVDGRGYDELGTRDELVGRVQAAAPGLRPVLFYSAYEALLWAVLSARRPERQMARVRDALARRDGAVFDVAGDQLAAVPLPERILELDQIDGLPDVKVRRMHGVAQAALDGRLDTPALRVRDEQEVSAELQQLEGIGPFYAMLTTVRALGSTDAVPADEPRLLAAAARLVGRDEPLDPAEYRDLAAAWTPWRTWVSVAIRATAADAPGRGRR
ncbi:DNA-3-methyladenine glycosylase 2 family protein [Cellulomonas sp. JH27-2]|uniref:DNA-3-methyladenine glycosylase family protein n=1 Tax=Cellulomonas sp. JH27-2 TaxID=2774139 RepID=UPI00177CF70E|nr:DNA-3-methyladenine glycosylase 2 family protein [Cellulomonas sp. JH27-2]MBD8059766.1 DNA-3-methyladenine glycosylase 2 family protein [Cellulomonas sp. JH27-2]